MISATPVPQYLVGIGPRSSPGKVTRQVTVDATSEPGAFRQAMTDLEPWECVYSIVPTTCQCGMWPIDEYGRFCPSCSVKED